VTRTEWDDHEWKAKAWVIGIPTLLLCGVQLGLELFRRDRPGNSDDARGMMDLPVDRSVPVAVVIQRAANTFSWILGLFASISLVGFIISVPLFVLFYLGIQAKESWWVAFLYAGVMLLFLIGVFHLVLHIPWPEGVFPHMEETILSWLE